MDAAASADADQANMASVAETTARTASDNNLDTAGGASVGDLNNVRYRAGRRFDAPVFVCIVMPPSSLIEPKQGQRLRSWTVEKQAWPKAKFLCLLACPTDKTT